MKKQHLHASYYKCCVRANLPTLAWSHLHSRGDHNSRAIYSTTQIAKQTHDQNRVHCDTCTLKRSQTPRSSMSALVLPTYSKYA